MPLTSLAGSGESADLAAWRAELGVVPALPLKNNETYTPVLPSVPTRTSTPAATAHFQSGRHWALPFWYAEWMRPLSNPSGKVDMMPCRAGLQCYVTATLYCCTDNNATRYAVSRERCDRTHLPWKHHSAIRAKRHEAFTRGEVDASTRDARQAHVMHQRQLQRHP
jgi:hypothetical protein